jgi:5'-methylthioadenosine phosphorylase
MKDFTIGVIGGSGIYEMDGLEILGEKFIDTPYGAPSAEVMLASLGGKRIAFIPRHGKGHAFNPSKVNYRANIFALKTVGVESVISLSAVGSLKEELKPRDFVIPSQIIDKTKVRANTFFDDMAVHVGFAEPFCKSLGDVIEAAAGQMDINVHRGGTYVCMEGPLFSTKAESELHRSWGASIIGMTAIPEAKLAREAEMCYATIALVTDYDVWKDETVSVEAVIETLNKNSENAKVLLRKVIDGIDSGDDRSCVQNHCSCQSALRNAVMTSPELILKDTRTRLEPLLKKYFPVDEGEF